MTSPVRWREDTGWEMRCDDCRRQHYTAWWPLDAAFWDTGALNRCRACKGHVTRLYDAFQRPTRPTTQEVRERDNARHAKRRRDPRFRAAILEQQALRQRDYYDRHRLVVLARRRAEYAERVGHEPPEDVEGPSFPRKCMHPRPARERVVTATETFIRCARCDHRFDPLMTRRGASSRRLGGNQERRIERVYGPTKIGEFGSPVDHVGALWKWQSKATRAAKPLWLAGITVATYRPIVPVAILRALSAMARYYPTLSPVVIRSFVRAGVKPDDFLFTASGYWDATADPGYFVIPGTVWLDTIGSDHAR